MSGFGLPHAAAAAAAASWMGCRWWWGWVVGVVGRFLHGAIDPRPANVTDRIGFNWYWKMSVGVCVELSEIWYLFYVDTS